ncbi:MAG TPA: exonuclease SbcCD subunit D C-terminal domain-containing protein, partial [Planctomycetota bacterium]|nr:exonuclease SbcCD subunit D C-terminal domain-containing protein [Planctomycetota bacterium]
LATIGVRVIGGVVRNAAGQLVTEHMLVPLRDTRGEVGALCVAIPFLRGSDVMALVPPPTPEPVAADQGDFVLRRPGDGGASEADPLADPLIGGMRALHGELFAAARAALAPGQALVVMAHGYLVGGALSELSERKVLGGNQHALPLDLFPPDCAYVALGHLHRPQSLAGRDHVRYSGSPIPLSMPERLHAHHVVFADLEGERLRKVWSLRVPRLVPLVRIPERGELEPEAALAAVAALPPRDAAEPDELRPFVEVAVRLPQPSPHLGERIARLIADKNARLVRVDVVLTGSEAGAGSGERAAELGSLLPEQVFVRRYHRDHAGPVPEPLLAAFRELLDAVQHGGAS